MDDAVVADSSHRNSRSAAAADHRRHRCSRRLKLRLVYLHMAVSHSS